jgi:bacterioferritin-associated ferredoxin
MNGYLDDRPEPLVLEDAVRLLRALRQSVVWGRTVVAEADVAAGRDEVALALDLALGALVVLAVPPPLSSTRVTWPLESSQREQAYQPNCPWCWQELGEHYPPSRSGGICRRHARELIAESRARHPHVPARREDGTA